MRRVKSPYASALKKSGLRRFPSKESKSAICNSATLYGFTEIRDALRKIKNTIGIKSPPITNFLTARRSLRSMMIARIICIIPPYRAIRLFTPRFLRPALCRPAPVFLCTKRKNICRETNARMRAI